MEPFWSSAKGLRVTVGSKKWITKDFHLQRSSPTDGGRQNKEEDADKVERHQALLACSSLPRLYVTEY